MKRSFARFVLFWLTGAMALLLLQWHFQDSWGSYYSRFPWKGYQQAMSDGQVPAFLTGSPRSLLVGGLGLLSLSLVALWFAAGRIISSTLALWMGGMASLVAVWIATPALRQDSNLWPLDFLFLAVCTGFPLCLGALFVLVIWKRTHPYRAPLNPDSRPNPLGGKPDFMEWKLCKNGRRNL